MAAVQYALMHEWVNSEWPNDDMLDFLGIFPTLDDALQAWAGEQLTETVIYEAPFNGLLPMPLVVYEVLSRDIVIRYKRLSHDRLRLCNPPETYRDYKYAYCKGRRAIEFDHTFRKSVPEDIDFDLNLTAHAQVSSLQDLQDSDFIYASTQCLCNEAYHHRYDCLVLSNDEDPPRLGLLRTYEATGIWNNINGDDRVTIQYLYKSTPTRWCAYREDPEFPPEAVVVRMRWRRRLRVWRERAVRNAWRPPEGPQGDLPPDAWLATAGHAWRRAWLAQDSALLRG